MAAIRLATSSPGQSAWFAGISRRLGTRVATILEINGRAGSEVDSVKLYSSTSELENMSIGFEIGTSPIKTIYFKSLACLYLAQILDMLCFKFTIISDISIPNI